jgi:multidrug efflux pump subunit AcrA (membrane-fusion protein)
VGAIGAIQQANAAAAAAEAQQKALEEQARQEEEAGKIEAENFRRRQRAAADKNVAIRAGSGVEVSAGTPLFVAMDEWSEIENTANQLQFDRSIRAYRKEQEAQIEGMKASNFKAAGPLNAGASLLGGMFNAASVFA